MAFINSNASVLSFAEYQDVLDREARVFEVNEGLSEEDIEDQLIRTTNRIVSKLSADLGWDVDKDLIISRKDDFTQLCVDFALAEYILPKVADFGDEENAEKLKIDFYGSKFEELYNELIKDGNWYDSDNDGSVTDSDNISTYTNLRSLRRIR